jgi:hypothetical protein
VAASFFEGVNVRVSIVGGAMQQEGQQKCRPSCFFSRPVIGAPCQGGWRQHARLRWSGWLFPPEGPRRPPARGGGDDDGIEGAATDPAEKATTTTNPAMKMVQCNPDKCKFGSFEPISKLFSAVF